MAETKKIIPKRRFKEFQNSEAWEQCKLDQIVDIVMGQSPDGSTYTDIPSDYILVQGNADLKGGWVSPRIWTTQVTKKANAGDLIMSVRAPAGEIGKTAYNVVLGRGVAAIKGNEFVFQSLLKMNENCYWKKLSSGSTFDSLNSDNIRNAELFIPTQPEQTKIGLFFTDIDNLITLHQRKLDKIKSTKKAYLYEMFPAEGESKPKRRFKGFSKDWELRHLGDKMYIKARIGWQSLSKSEYLKSGDYYLITGTDIDERSHTIDLSKSFYVSKDRYEMDNKIQIQEGDIIVTKDGTIGKVAIVTDLDKPATLNSHLFVLRDLSGKLNNYFLLTLLTSPIFDEFVDRTKTGSTLTGMPQKTFVNFNYLVPSIEEQNKIAQFFKNLDNLITLHQHKLDKLKNLKKAYLNEMFI